MTERRQPIALSQWVSQAAHRPAHAFSTSVHRLDTMLGGGIVPGQLYELYGLNNSGKQQLALQLCESANGMPMKKEVLWISMLQGAPPSTHNRHALKHTRITSIGALYLFIQALQSQYALIIIEDFATSVNRSMGVLDSMILKPKISIETRRNNTIIDCIKLLSLHCRKFGTACLMINAVDTINMSFVQIDQSIEHYHSSQQQHQQQLQRKKFYQQILTSALGEHPIWNDAFRARIMLYKDWSQGNTTTAVYAHIRHNKSMKLMLSSRGIEKQVVSFHLTKRGLSETLEMDVSKDYTLDSDDLDESNDVGEDAQTVSASSPCDNDNDDGNDDDDDDDNDNDNEIQNAREMLSSQIQGNGLTQQELELLLESDMEDELHSDTVVTVEQTLVNTEPDLTFDIYKDNELQSEPMIEDTSLQEIDDEMEELFPTQPEAISIVQLSQLTQLSTFPASKKRRVGRHKVALMDVTDVNVTNEADENEVPATFPFF